MDFQRKSDALHRIPVENDPMHCIGFPLKTHHFKWRKSKFVNKQEKVDFQWKSDAVHRISVENPFFFNFYIFIYDNNKKKFKTNT